MAARIFLVDDHDLLRETLRLLFESQPDLTLVAEAGSVREALGKIDGCAFDVMLLDLSMPGMGGLSLLRELKRRRATQPVLVLSMHAEAERVAELLSEGAAGYVLKSDASTVLVSAIGAVLAGRTFLSPRIDARAVERIRAARSSRKQPGPLGALSSREREIFDLLVRNFSTAEIARELCISGKTVESHREHIFAKLDIHSICELVRYAARWHLLDFDLLEEAPPAPLPIEAS
jgi:DNA-binding NarL/FixJ family response regulator